MKKLLNEILFKKTQRETTITTRTSNQKFI